MIQNTRQFKSNGMELMDRVNICLILSWARENGYDTDYEACRNFHKRVVGGQSAHRKEVKIAL